MSYTFILFRTTEPLFSYAPFNLLTHISNKTSTVCTLIWHGSLKAQILLMEFLSIYLLKRNLIYGWQIETVEMVLLSWVHYLHFAQIVHFNKTYLRFFALLKQDLQKGKNKCCVLLWPHLKVVYWAEKLNMTYSN